MKDEPVNITEAVKRACQEPTLADALAWIAVWENDRAVKQAIRNHVLGEQNPDGSLWDTCFRRCFEEVLASFPHASIER
jgi:hypothetical protein